MFTFKFSQKMLEIESNQKMYVGWRIEKKDMCMNNYMNEFHEVHKWFVGRLV